MPGGVALHPFVGQRRAGDVAAKLFQRLAVIGATAAFRRTRGFGAQILFKAWLPRHRALHRQHLLAGARTEALLRRRRAWRSC